jgi:hypothetical protein
VPTTYTPGTISKLLAKKICKDLIHAGDHQPIIERELFEAVYAQLKSGAVDRKLKHVGTPDLLKGKLFDSAGNQMTPSHGVKKGVSYRSYVSQAVLGSRPASPGGPRDLKISVRNRTANDRNDLVFAEFSSNSNKEASHG